MRLGNLLSIDILILVFAAVTCILYISNYKKTSVIKRYYIYCAAAMIALTLLDLIFAAKIYPNYAVCIAFIMLYLILNTVIPYLLFLHSLEIIQNTSILGNMKRTILCSLPACIFSILLLLSPFFNILLEINNHKTSIDIIFNTSFSIGLLLVYIIYLIAISFYVLKKWTYISEEYIISLLCMIILFTFGIIANFVDNASIPYLYIFALSLFLLFYASLSSITHKNATSLNAYNRNHFINTLTQLISDKRDFIIVAISIDQYEELENNYKERDITLLMKDLINCFNKIFPSNEIYHYDNLHFILIFEKTPSLKSAGPIIDDILSIFNMPWNIGKKREKMTVTISSLFCPEDSDSTTEILDVLRNSINLSQKSENGSIVYGKDYIYSKEREITNLISENRKLEQMANQAANYQSNEKQTESERAVFLANISHDIRTPLNSITGLSELLLKENLQPSAKNKAESIKMESTSLLYVFNNIMEYFNIDSGRFEIIESSYKINDIAKESINIIITQTKEKNLDMNYKINPSIPNKIIGDYTHIRQLLINILRHSLKQTDTGSITLDIDYELTDNSKIMLIITIKDTSVGYQPKELENIFNNLSSFDTRRNNNMEESALALDVCKKLTDILGGEITVNSQYGEGCTYCFHIPQKIEDLTPLSKAEKTIDYKTKSFSETFTAPDANILVVDDNRLNREITKGLLKPYGVNITLANSGEECLKLVRQNIYDLIFMDHLMPGMDGIDTKNNIRKLDGTYFKTVPIIILTANVTAESRETFINEGFADYIPKPIDISLLDSSLKKNLPKELIKELV